MSDTAHWVLPIKNDWRCPRCGDRNSYGTRRSLWSLLPFVCIHRVQSWDERVKKYPGSSEPDGMAYIEVGKTVSISEHTIKWKLRNRLSDELKGRRRFWWWRHTPEVRAELERTRAAMRGL